MNKRTKYIFIKETLKDILHCAKNNYKYTAISTQYELCGALRYMYITNEITQETKSRVNHLATLILRKYNIK